MLLLFTINYNINKNKKTKKKKKKKEIHEFVLIFSLEWIKVNYWKYTNSII